MSLPSSEKQRTQNVLRLFLDPLLGALVTFGTSAYVPVPKTDRCLQLLLTLLRTSPWRGSGAQEGEDVSLGSCSACHCIQEVESVSWGCGCWGWGSSE